MGGGVGVWDGWKGDEYPGRMGAVEAVADGMYNENESGVVRVEVCDGMDDLGTRTIG